MTIHKDLIKLTRKIASINKEIHDRSVDLIIQEIEKCDDADKTLESETSKIIRKKGKELSEATNLLNSKIEQLRL